MWNYIQKFSDLGRDKIGELSDEISWLSVSADSMHFSVDFLVLQNSDRVKEILIYAHTVWEFNTQEEANAYLYMFISIITFINQQFPTYVLYYIQNYEWFNPTKYIDYIRQKTWESPLKQTLEILPFENQRRVCESPPDEITRAMPKVIFSRDIWVALEELGLFEKHWHIK